jgi:trehalose/maltose hydrolase-like predicted phosphorylase
MGTSVPQSPNFNLRQWRLDIDPFRYVGASVAAAGPFFELDVNQTDPNGVQVTNGWPLFSPRLSFSTISGFYDIQPNGTGTNFPWLNQYGYESFIAGIPHSTAIIFSFGDSYLDATASNTTISGFSSSISFKTGVASWSYRWSPNDAAHFDVGYTAFFSRARPNVIAVQATIVASSDIQGTVTDLLDGRSAMRSYLDSKGLINQSQTIYSAVHPNDLANITAYVFSTADFDEGATDMSSRKLAEGKYVSLNESTIGQSFDINLKAGKKATFTKYIGVASTDKFADAKTVAEAASNDADHKGWDELLEEHEEAWAKLLQKDTVDDFTDPATGLLPDNEAIQILHISSVANTFYLLQNLQPDGSGLNDNSVAVGGLASDSYAGLIFWDADYWMAPGLNLAFPGYSKQISNYRIKQHPQALANAAFNGYEKGASLYSWTSGRYGNCTGTGPCVDYEYHLNYDIANNLFQQKNITQNLTWFNNGARQVIESTALMTSELLKYNATTQTYWLHNATDPDE